MVAAVDPRAIMAGLMDRLTGAGGAFEIVEQDVCRVCMPVLADRERALAQLLVQSRAYGDADYLVTDDGRLSFRQHFQAVASLACALSTQFGIGKGDRVAIIAANAPEWTFPLPSRRIRPISPPHIETQRKRASGRRHPPKRLGP